MKPEPASLLLCMLLHAVPLPAQWAPFRTPALPRTEDGKPVLTAKTPRMADGKPDLSGLWKLPTEAYWYDIGADLNPTGLPLQPWAAAVYRERSDSFGKDNPIARCMPAGAPTIDIIPTPFRIIQTPYLTAILYEYNLEYRQIFTDGRTPTGDPNPNWLGYSVGRWEGDMFVVETKGLKDNTWLDLYGHPATGALDVIERFTRVNLGSMNLDITLTDPKAYTRPWTIVLHLQLLPDTEILEYVCIENNKGIEHLVGR